MWMSLLLQEGPAETTGYMVAGYIIIFAIMLGYLASLVIRNRNLKRDLDLLHELEKDQR
jgi:hypothetical protein